MKRTPILPIQPNHVKREAFARLTLPNVTVADVRWAELKLKYLIAKIPNYRSYPNER